MSTENKHTIITQLESMLDELHENRTIVTEVKEILGLKKKSEIVDYVTKLKDGATIGQPIDVGDIMDKVDELLSELEGCGFYEARDNITEASDRVEEIECNVDNAKAGLEDVIVELRESSTLLEESEEK